MLNKNLLQLPTPISINYWFNFGSLLGILMSLQVISGVILTMFYSTRDPFEYLSDLQREVSNGYLLRLIHMNLASFIFICLYIHIARGLRLGSVFNIGAWNRGILLYLLIMGTAFLGYVLPWGQMSFWGATVITSLLSIIPYLGYNILNWIWGGFRVSIITVQRFYSLHFLIPLIVMAIIGIHIFYLHNTGSRNPLGYNSSFDFISFHKVYSIKDSLGLVCICLFISFVVYIKPWLFLEHDNFNISNRLVTPEHIKPEWYFLWAYAILRAFPNKTYGVIFMLFGILIFLILPYIKRKNIKNEWWVLLHKLIFSCFLIIFICLTWIGSSPAEYPYIFYGQIFTFLYFLTIIISYII